MVDFVATLGVVTSFVYKVLNMPFFHLGTYGGLVLMLFCLLLLVSFFAVFGKVVINVGSSCYYQNLG